MTTSWGYTGTVGAWNASLDGGALGDCEDRLTRVIDALRAAARGLDETHRPRHVSMEWAEIDNRGIEIAFHDDDETDVDSWDGVVGCLRKLQADSVRAVVESVFVDCDVEVELDNGLAWLERAAEIQLGAGDPIRGSRVEISFSFSTNVDIWLGDNLTTRKLGVDNQALAQTNLPRLERALAQLQLALGVPFEAFYSDRYRDELTNGGFRVR